MLSISTSSAHSQLSVLVVDTQKRDGVDMAKLTKAQKKRLVSEIMRKTSKLDFDSHGDWGPKGGHIINTKDLEAVERLTDKWMKRIG